MSVGLLIITHNEIGSALLETATRMLGTCPLHTETLAVTEDATMEALRAEARRLAERIDMGEGILVLTDMFGSTPANVARTLYAQPQVRVLAGVNLPMIVRTLNYPYLGLAELAAKAESGGREGVFRCGEYGPHRGNDG